MEGLSFFTRTSAKHLWVVAAYHDPRSLTWSWGLWFGLFRSGEKRVFPIFWWARREWGLRIPFVGFLLWRSQEKMLHPTPQGEKR